MTDQRAIETGYLFTEEDHDRHHDYTLKLRALSGMAGAPPNPELAALLAALADEHAALNSHAKFVVSPKDSDGSE